MDKSGVGGRVYVPHQGGNSQFPEYFGNHQNGFMGGVMLHLSLQSGNALSSRREGDMPKGREARHSLAPPET